MSIFRLYEVVESVHNLYLAMEYAHGGELFARLTGDKGPYREKPDAKVIFAQIASAIDYMHQNFFIHRSEMRICPPPATIIFDIATAQQIRYTWPL